MLGEGAGAVGGRAECLLRPCATLAAICSLAPFRGELPVPPPVPVDAGTRAGQEGSGQGYECPGEI